MYRLDDRRRLVSELRQICGSERLVSPIITTKVISEICSEYAGPNVFSCAARANPSICSLELDNGPGEVHRKS